MRPAVAFLEAQLPLHSPLGRAICSVDRLLALAPARLKEQRAWVALFSAVVRLRLRLKQSQPLLDSEEVDYLVVD